MKRYLFAILSLSAVVGWYFLGSVEREHKNKETDDKPNQLSTEKTIEAAPIYDSDHSVPIDIDELADTKKEEVVFTGELPKELQEYEDRGYFRPSEMAPYIAYDDETLLGLIQEDDRKAAVQYIENASSYEGKCERAEIAMQTGITGNAINYLIICITEKIPYTLGRGISDGSPERKAVLEMLSVIQYAALMGDYWSMSLGDSQLERYGIELTDEDYKVIRDLALQRLDRINRQRENNGLMALVPQPNSSHRAFHVKNDSVNSMSEWQRSLLGFR